jgi:hypothetical protein
MRHIIMFFVFLLFSAAAYAGEIRSAGPVILVERQARDVKAVMYMTTW